MMQPGTGRLRRHAATFIVLLLTALMTTGMYGPAAAEPVAPPAQDQASGQEQGRTMLVLDASGSMSGSAGGGRTKIDAAKSALRTVVKGLPDDANVGLRVFGAKVFSRNDPGSCQDSQVVVKPGVDNRDALLSEIDKYEPYGETPIPHALREAAKDLGGEGARSIVLVSDGESTCDPDPCQVAEDLAEKGIDLRIDVVGLSVSGKARSQLKCIAKAGNGDYFDADDAADIESTLTRVAKRAAQPFTLVGAPVSGGTETAPTPVTPGNWVDTIGPDTEYYSFERTEAGTTLRVSAVTQGGYSGTNDVISIVVTDPDGRRCSSGFINRVLNTRSLSGAQATAGKANECDRPGTYTIAVSRGRSVGEDAPVGLRVTEEPAVTEPGFVAAQDAVEVGEPTFQGAAETVAGTASFEDAPELTTGVWSSDVVPGEALVYRFRLEHGQSASVGLRFAAGTSSHRDGFNGSAPVARISLHNPLMANLGFPRGAVFSGRVGESEQTTFRTATHQVSQAGGTVGGAFDGGADYTVAGDYYVMIAVSRAETLELPFQIDLQIEGDPAEGPTYADGVNWTVTDGVTGGGDSDEPGSQSDSDTESVDSEETAAADETSSDTMRTGLGIATGLLAVAVLATVLLLRRRRTTA